MSVPQQSSRIPKLVMWPASAALFLAAAGTAQGAITVTLVGPNSAPLVDESVTLRAADGGYVDSLSTNAAGVVTFTLRSSAPAGPYSANANVSTSYSCVPSVPNQTATQGGLVDGAAATLTVNVPMLCPGSQASGAPDPTGLFDQATSSILALPGGTVDVRHRLPFDATDIQISGGGVPLSTPGGTSSLRVTAPAAGYTGPLTLSYTYKGVAGSYGVGNMTSRAVTATPPTPGPIDIAAIVDVSGSMSGTDPKFIRKDAMKLLIDLMRKGDKLGAVGFDDSPQTIFGLTDITGEKANADALKAAANRGIINRNGTDYNVGMNDANTMLTTTAGVDPKRQKAVVFLTDGEHNGGTYANGHVRFAMNASGRPWPVCAIQLGTSTTFAPDSVARLQRIASETGGKYFTTATAGRLSDIYAQCFNLVAAQRTLSTKVFTFTQGKAKQVVRTVPKGLRQGTFFASWGDGAYQLTLIDPKGKKLTARVPGKSAIFRRGATFAFFRINKPMPGKWTIQLKNVRLTTPNDQGRVTITTPK